jgi:hypothetical protein
MELYLCSHNMPSWHDAQLKKHRDNLLVMMKGDGLWGNDFNFTASKIVMRIWIHDSSVNFSNFFF